MTTYISILRGINVSGHKMIKMEALRKMYAELKLENIESYIQSGNIVFQAKNSIAKELEKIISKQISDKFGFEVPVVVKALNELKEVADNNPFVNKNNYHPLKLHVTFLSDVPLQENIEKIKDADYGQDEYFINNKTIYLFCPNGYGKTKLANGFFESKLKVSATTRNWRTINELVKIAEKF